MKTTIKDQKSEIMEYKGKTYSIKKTTCLDDFAGNNYDVGCWAFLHECKDNHYFIYAFPGLQHQEGLTFLWDIQAKISKEEYLNYLSKEAKFTDDDYANLINTSDHEGTLNVHGEIKEIVK